jgi:prepilin-type N-terminal cleavage/methylation domain-containing protein
VRQYHGSRAAFTIIEMIVALAVIAILVGIALAVGRQVINTTRREMTRSELTALLGAEQSVVHKTAGVVPDSMYDFLVAYQRLHAYQDTNGVWRMRSNMLTRLPPSMVKTSMVPMPNGGSMLMITQVNDAWGNPIQFLPTVFYNPHAPCFVSNGEDGILGTADDIHSYDP